MAEKLSEVPLMKRSPRQITDNIFVTEKFTEFLDNCEPGFGNVFKNNKRETDNDPEFIGHGKLNDGTPVRIEGISKDTASGVKIMPVRIIEIPHEIYERKEKIIKYSENKVRDEQNDFL